MTSNSRPCRRSPLGGAVESGADRLVVAVPESRQHAVVVDAGRRAQPADDPGDERAVPGLHVEAAVLVVVVLVVVVDDAGGAVGEQAGPALTHGLRTQPRVVDEAGRLQQRVGGEARPVDGARRQARVEHQDPRRPPADVGRRRRLRCDLHGDGGEIGLGRRDGRVPRGVGQEFGCRGSSGWPGNWGWPGSSGWRGSWGWPRSWAGRSTRSSGGPGRRARVGSRRCRAPPRPTVPRSPPSGAEAPRASTLTRRRLSRDVGGPSSPRARVVRRPRRSSSTRAWMPSSASTSTRSGRTTETSPRALRTMAMLRSAKRSAAVRRPWFLRHVRILPWVACP